VEMSMKTNEHNGDKTGTAAQERQEEQEDNDNNVGVDDYAHGANGESVVLQVTPEMKAKGNAIDDDCEVPMELITQNTFLHFKSGKSFVAGLSRARSDEPGLQQS